MKLRILTIGLVVFTLLTFAVGAQWVGKAPPKNAPKEQLKAYVSRSSTFIGLIVVGILGSGITSLLEVRRSREEYRKAASQNLEQLVLGVAKAKPKENVTEEQGSQEPS